MLITLKVITPKAEHQEFKFKPDNLGAGLDTVSMIVLMGNQLKEVVLIDQNFRTPLPIEAFDGHNISDSIQHLEAQLTIILHEAISNQKLLDKLYHQRTTLHYKNIPRFEQAIELAEQRLQRMQKTISREPDRTRILNQLKLTLERYQHNLATEEASLQEFIKAVAL